VNEVSCRACAPIVEAIRERELSPEELVKGLSFGVDDLRHSSNRVPWDDYAVFLERAARALGGGEQLESLAGVYSRSTGILRALASSFVGVQPLYALGAKWYGPSIFASTRGACEMLPDGRVRVSVEILPPYRDSEEFFRMIRGGLRTTPSLLGQPDAQVEMELHPRRAVYTITPPPALTLWGRIRRTFSRRWVIAETIQELVVHHEEVQESYRRAREATAQLAAQSRRLVTINRLGHDLVRHTEIGELAGSVMKLLQDHFQVERGALWLVPPEGGELKLLRRVGEPWGEPCRRHALMMANREVGRLDLPESECSEGPETRDVLEELLPWIALALDNAHSFDALSRQTQWLEEEIRERKRAQERLHQVQKMEVVGQLAGGLAHDFNNILTAISGYAELACARLAESDPVRRDIEEIGAVSERAAGLVKQVLAFSRRQMLLPRRLDLNSVILGMEKMLARLIGEAIELVMVPGRDVGPVVADPGQLEQVIVNLVVNGRDAISGGGRITIETSNVEYGETDAQLSRAERPGRYVRLEVRDTGVGMDEKTKERVFEPFFSTKPLGGGTGLGLSTVYGVVTQSGGTVNIESEFGRGTTVTIHLPRADGKLDGLEVVDVREGVAGGKETLLLVEDDESVRTATQRILAGKGYTVLTAAHGEEALALCRSHPGSIDLLVTDVVMPELSGHELAHRIGPLRPEVRGVVFMSGYANDDVGAEGSPSQERIFLRKPFNPTALRRAVRRILDS
jgi:signal transduction histidine kinase